MRWTDAAVREALGLPAGGGADRAFTGLSTDTRSLAPGNLFVALTGERFDGHDWLAATAAAGAAGAVVRRGTVMPEGLPAYEVDDPLVAWGWLARHRRRALPGPVVAITGTNGKTSAKEMMAAALRTRYRTWATRLNLNNLVGVPQTILEAPADVEALVVEAGANQPGEIARYRSIIEPAVAIITNVAEGHLEGFGSIEGVMQEKLSLARDVPLAVVGTEPPALAAGARRLARRVVTAGLAGADVVPEHVEVGPAGQAALAVDGQQFMLGLRGRHQAANAMLVWVVARELGLEPAAVAAALAGATVPGARTDLRQVGGLTLLDDSYNANPASYRAVIDLAAGLRQDRRLVFVAAGMRELGPGSAALHAEVAGWLVELAPDVLAAVGEFGPALEAHRAALGDRLVTAPDADALAPALLARLRGDEVVVLKGSRGEALERLLPHLTAWTASRG
jgi:UDP-N-acetylmuramoyl-tripeptide--D-alanyl-D-alanine ligase